MLNEVSIDWSVLLFAFVAVRRPERFRSGACVAGERVDLTDVEQETRGSKGSGEQARTRRVLVGTEFALLWR